MKTAIKAPAYYLALMFILLYSCDLLSKDETKAFIPGMYTRHYKDEYTDSYDTIWIQLTSQNDYLITKRSSYQKINDQNNRVSGSEVRKWLGTYDKRTGALFLPSPGKNIFFNVKNKELRMGTEPYKKLKQ